MEKFLTRYTLPFFWVLILLDCIFLYFDLPYIAITEPFLVPLLLLFLFLKDENIGKPVSKFIFYVGLIFSFFGDVLQLVVTNGLFFSTSLMAFIIMNICYTISFVSLTRGMIFRPLLLAILFMILLLIAYLFLSIMGNDFGGYLMPFIIYIGTLIIMFISIFNLAGSPQYSTIAYKYFIPGTIFLIIQNMAFSINLFRFNGQSKGFIISLICYAAFQFLMAMGVLNVYKNIPVKNSKVHPQEY